MKKPEGWVDKGPIKFELAVIIGRFQPFHNGHFALVEEANLMAKNTLILIGSANIAPDIKNPFSYNDRVTMIAESCRDAKIPRPTTKPLNDFLYSESDWIRQVQDNIKGFFLDGFDANDVVIVGNRKDESSYYLDLFPEYKVHEIATKREHTLHSTDIRETFFWNGFVPMGVMPPYVETFLTEYRLTKEFVRVAAEYQAIKKYKLQWANAPFPPTFVTTDAVVINNGHILLVKRRHAPGEGLWALPGGFINQNEFIQDSMIRELVEETRIKVSEERLVNSIRDSKVFDNPGRSLRGRTITHAYLISLFEKNLPKVRGADDAERAKWVSISDFYRMSDKMFEDHFSIATYFINRA